MPKLGWITPLVLLGLVFGGCSKPAEKAAASETPKTEAPARAPGGAATSAPSKETPAPTAKLEDLPASLKTSAFEWYGLANAEPMKMEIRSSQGGEPRIGTQTVTLKSIEGEKAIFSITRTEGLEALGAMDVRLTPEGIFVESSTVAKVGEKDLEMPTKLDPGATWSQTTNIDNGGSTMSVTNRYQVDGPQKVTTKAGAYDAILITSTGSGTMNGTATNMRTKAWYVKNVGAVKAEITTTSQGQKPVTITIERIP